MSFSYEDAAAVFSHINSITFGHLGESRIAFNRYNPQTITDRNNDVLLSKGWTIAHLIDAFSPEEDLHSEFDIDLYNERKIHVIYDNTDGHITLDCTGIDTDGSPYRGENNQGVGGYGSFNYGSYDMVTLGWLSYGMDLVVYQQISSENNINTYYEMGIALIPSAMSVGTHYPIAGGAAEISWHDTFPIIWKAPFFNDTQSQVEFDNIIDFIGTSFYIDEQYPDGDDSSDYGGGGGGSFSDRNDYIGIPPIPTINAIDTGFIAIYQATAAQLQDLADWLWSPSFFDNILKNYSDPFNNILGLWESPIIPPTRASELRIGNVLSGMTMNKLSAQYSDRNCGTVGVREYYGSYADYEPYRQFKLFLPYIGVVDLNTDDFMGGSIQVYYRFDHLTGMCIAFIQTNNRGTPHVIAQHTGNIYSSIPFSGRNMMDFYGSLVSGATQAISGIASGNAGAALSGAYEAITAKPTYAHSSGMSANTGFLGVQVPYLIECRSVRDMPRDYGYNEGIPLNAMKQVSNCTGYTEFTAIHVKISGATDNEQREIERLLKEGVII